MDLKRQVVSGLRWSAGARFLGQLITWGITIVVMRLLAPADYGLMALAGVFIAFLAMLNELGLGAAVIQKRNLSSESMSALFGMLLLISLAFYLLIYSAAPLIAAFYDEPKLQEVIRVLGIQFLLIGLTIIPQSLLMRQMAFKEISIVNFISAIAGSVVTLVFALAGAGVWALVWGNIALRAVMAVSMNLLRHAPVPRFSTSGMRELLSFGGYVTLSRIFWYLYTQADSLIIGKLLGKELLGFYSVGMYLASMPMNKISGVLNQLAFPAFTTVQAQPELAGRHFLKAVRIVSFFSFPALWGMSSLAPEIIQVFLGEKWSAASLPLQIVALAIPIRMISNLMHPALMGMGRPDLSFVNSLFASVVMPAAFIIGMRWGLPGVSMAWIIAFPVVFVINLRRLVELLRLEIIDVMNAMKLPVAAGLAMYMSVLLLKGNLAHHFQQVLGLVVLVLGGALIYSAVMLLFNRNGIREIMNLARS